MEGIRTVIVLQTWICFLLNYVLVYGADPPIMDTAEITVKVKERDTVFLPCMVDTITEETANKYKILWMNPKNMLLTVNAATIISNPRFEVSRPFSKVWNLKISPVRAEDAGIYRCQLNTEPDAQQKTVNLIVFVKPKISASPTVKVIEGRELRMYCNISGIPRPSLTWFKQGQLLKNYTEELFRIKVVSRTDAGEYRCDATSQDDKDSKNINVIVYYAPTVRVHNQRIGQMPNKQAILDCHSTGNPPGTVGWYRNGNKLETNWRYETQSFVGEGDNRTLSLHVRSVATDDYGTYVCTAENEVGRDHVTLTLYELSTPPVPAIADQVPATRRYNFDTERRTTRDYSGVHMSRGDGTSARRQIITDSTNMKSDELNSCSDIRQRSFTGLLTSCLCLILGFVLSF